MRWWPRLAWVAAFAVPLLVFSIGSRYVGSGDTVPAELLPVSVLEHGTLTFPQTLQPEWLPYWFHATDRGVVSAYPILPGLLNVPVYAAARFAHLDLGEKRFLLSRLTAAIVASLSVVFVYGILQPLLGSRRRALAFAFLYAFATEVWSVAARGLYQHGPALLFLSAGLYFILRAGPRSTIAAGLCLGFAVLARPTAAAIALPLAAYAVSRHRSSAWRLAVGASIPAVLHGAYAWRFWGSPFSPAQAVGTANFSGNFLQGLAGLLVSPSRGLLVFSPVFLLALPALVAALGPAAGSTRGLSRALAWGVVLTLLIYSKWPIWWGGHSFGYRLLLELSLPLTLLLALDWERIRASRAATALFTVTLVVSVSVQALGSFAFPTRFNDAIDRDPSRLWDIGESELALCVRKAFRIPDGSSDSSLARHLRRSPPPAPSWWSGTADSYIPGSLDIPAASSVVRGPLTVLGWAKPGLDDPGEVLVSINPGSRRFRPDRFSRPDVAGAAPHIGDTSAAGFGLRVPPPTRLESGSVLVEVRDRQGRVSRMGPVAILWGPARAVAGSERTATPVP